MDDHEVSDESRLMEEFEPETKHRVRSRKARGSGFRVACSVILAIAIVASIALIVMYTWWSKHHAHSTGGNVTARVLQYIDEGSCHSVFATECGDLSESYYDEFVYKGRRVVIFSQIPDHPAGQDAPVHNPNTRCTRWQFMTMPVNATKSDKFVETQMGAVGVSVTGAAFFNYLATPDGNLAMHQEGATLDSCGAHSAPGGMYHYHSNILCNTSMSAKGSTNRKVCKQLGWYFDGVPVYGLCNDKTGTPMTSCYRLKQGANTGTVNTYYGNVTSGIQKFDYEFVQEDFDAGKCNLDEASGAMHPATGKYSYFTTEEYPWVPSFYHGSAGATLPIIWDPPTYVVQTCSAN